MPSLGDIRIDLKSDVATFAANMKRASGVLGNVGAVAGDVGRRVGRFGATIAGAVGGAGAAIFRLRNVMLGVVGVLGGGFIANQLASVAEEVDTIGKKSAVLGVPIEQLSALRFVAAQSGLEFETLANLVSKAQKNLANFSLQGGNVDKSLVSLLPKLRQSNGILKPATETLPIIAKHLSEIKDVGQRIRLAEMIFGKAGGGAFLQLMSEAGNRLEGLAEGAKKAEALGQIFDQETFERMRDYGDAVQRVGFAFQGAVIRIFREFAPALTESADSLAAFIANVGRLGSDIGRVLQVAMGTTEEAAHAKDILISLWDSVVDHLQAQVTTRVKGLVLTIIEFCRIQFGSFISVLVEAFAAGASEIGGMIGTMLSGIGKGLALVGGKLGEAGASVADNWKQAQINLKAQLDELEKARSTGAIDFWIGKVHEYAAAWRQSKKDAEAAVAVPESEEAKSALREFIDGWKAGADEIANRVSSLSTLGKDLFSTMADGISSGFANAATDASNSFRNFGKAAMKVLDDVARSLVRVVIQFAMMAAISSAFGGTPVGFGSLSGAAIQPEQNATGTVLRSPVIFMRNGRWNTAAERGPEGVLPLTDVGGRLGVDASGVGPVVQIIDQRGAQAPPVEQRQATGPDGRKMLQIIIRDEVRKSIASGSLDTMMRATYGVRRFTKPT